MASWFWTALVTNGKRGTGALFRTILYPRAILWNRTEKGLPVPFSSLLLVAALALSGCSSKPPLTVYGAVTDFVLTDQSGAEFSSAAKLKDKVWIADFIYTNCPGPCPRMSSQMHQVETEFTGNDGIRFVSITVDPDRDTPPVLAEYAKHFEADTAKWFFLTGSREKLQDLSRRVFMLGDVDSSLEHSTRFALIDEKFRIRGYYVSSDKEAIPNLIADAKRLLKTRT
jgi:protein SCO1